MQSTRLPRASLLPRDTLIDQAKGCPASTMSEGFRRPRRQGQRSRPYADLRSFPSALRSSTTSLRRCGKKYTRQLTLVLFPREDRPAAANDESRFFRIAIREGPGTICHTRCTGTAAHCRRGMPLLHRILAFSPDALPCFHISDKRAGGQLAALASQSFQGAQSVGIQYATTSSNAKGATEQPRPADRAAMLHPAIANPYMEQPLDCNPLPCTVRFPRCDYTRLCASPPLDCPERSGLAEFLWQGPSSAF